MNRLRRLQTLFAVLLVALTVSACSVSVNTGSAPTPSPSPSHAAKPSPTPTPVSVVIGYHLHSSQCETNAQITVLVGGHAVGTMSVGNQSNTSDRLSVMLAPVNQKYSLKGTAFFQVNGQSFGLNVTGKGEAQVTEGPNTWSLNLDTSKVSTDGCPTQGGSWPLVVQTS